MNPDDLHSSPNALAPFYSRFRVDQRLLLTGHSHQAWPDCGLAAQQQAWLDAAELVDDKWRRAFAQADRVRVGFARLLDDRPDRIALGTSTHELVVRWLSALPLRYRPRLVTTDGEFHTLRRLLSRLAEEGLEVVRVPADPAAEVAARIVGAIDERTAAVMVSAVMFESAQIVPDLGRVAEVCDRLGARLLVDAYHALNVVPFSLPREHLPGAFVVGGGYKYCQLGEGNSFLRLPDDCDLRPVATGWFSEFDRLPEFAVGSSVAYGRDHARFAGATYDPASHYRAAAVFEFFAEQGLTPELLRAISQHQVGLLARAFDDLDLAPGTITRDRSVPLTGLGGFLVLRSVHAATLCRQLQERGVYTDHRGSRLRLGPAPYLTDSQLLAAIELLGDCVRLLPPA